MAAFITKRAMRASSVSISGRPRPSAFAPRAAPVVGKCMGVRLRPVATAAAAAAAAMAPTPFVKIDNMNDPFATVVSVSLGEDIEELLSTITSLKNLGLNIRRVKAKPTAGESPGMKNRFYLTEAETSEKIVKSDRLEEIRRTVIASIITDFPETDGAFGRIAMATSESDDEGPAAGRYRKVVKTTIDVSEAENGSCSVLKLETEDRPGLLVDIVRVLKDVNMNVVSAEVDTIGTMAHDEFFVTYKGEPLSHSMVTLVTNALQYYLSLNEVAREESY